MAPWRIVKETLLATFGDDEKEVKEKDEFVERTTRALRERNLVASDENKGYGYLIRQRRRNRLTRVELVEEEYTDDDL
jgi:hypothetical protein